MTTSAGFPLPEQRVGTRWLADVCLAVVPSMNKSCTNTAALDTPCPVTSQEARPGEGEGSAGAEAIAMGFVVVPPLWMRRHCHHIDSVERRENFEALHGESPTHGG